MSSFICDQCGKEILDSPTGYITNCDHYPDESSPVNRAKRPKVHKPWVIEIRYNFEWDTVGWHVWGRYVTEGRRDQAWDTLRKRDSESTSRVEYRRLDIDGRVIDE